jgi:hypothetical protein
MKAFGSLDGVSEVQTNISEALVYLRGKPGKSVSREEAKDAADATKKYRLRSFDVSTQTWAEIMKGLGA